MNFRDYASNFPRLSRPGLVVRVSASDADDDAVASLEAAEAAAGGPDHDPAGWSDQVVLRIAERDGDWVGYCASEPFGRVRRLHRVLVDPGLRRKKVGEALVGHLQRSVERGAGLCRGLDAVLDETDLDGLLFLKACGFRAVSHSDAIPDGPRVVNGLVRLRWVVGVAECAGKGA